MLTYILYCESSISLEGGRSKDRVQLCRLSMSFQESPHQKLFFNLKDKNYKKAKMKGGLGWMKNIGNDPCSLFNGNHFSSYSTYVNEAHVSVHMSFEARTSVHKSF